MIMKTKEWEPLIDEFFVENPQILVVSTREGCYNKKCASESTIHRYAGVV